MRMYRGAAVGELFRLDDKVAIVTGASSGIGAAAARALAQSGCSLALVGRDASRLGRTAQEVAAPGVRSAAISADLTSVAAPAQVVRDTLESFGKIDILVHSAGIYLQGALESADDSVLDEQWAVNVRAPYRLTQAVSPHLGRGGSIIFVSSMSGHVGSANDSAYCATKGAVELIVKALAVELAPRGVRVNAVAPGNVRTPMNATLITPEVEREILAFTPAGRIGLVDDIGPAVVFLASQEASNVHGVSLLVDGGWVAQ